MLVSWKTKPLPKRGVTLSNILETINAGNNGQLVIGLGKHLYADPKHIAAVLEKLVPWIAGHIQTKADNNPQDFTDLLEIVDDEEQVNFLEKPSWSFSQAAFDDGQDILSHLFGTQEKAFEASKDITDFKGLDEKAHRSIVLLTATYCVAAMASRNQALFLNDEPEDDEEPSGIWAVIIAALLKGLMQGLTRKRPRRRSRRRTYGRKRTTRKRSSTRRRKSTKTRRRKRHKKTPSLNDLIGDLFRG